jgi:hypothetical protein
MTWTGRRTVLPWIELHFPGRYRNDPAGASLDRIDHQKGYVPGNVRVISLRANLLRKDITPEELRALADSSLDPPLATWAETVSSGRPLAKRYIVTLP